MLLVNTTIEKRSNEYNLIQTINYPNLNNTYLYFTGVLYENN